MKGNEESLWNLKNTIKKNNLYIMTAKGERGKNLTKKNVGELPKSEGRFEYTNS